MVTKKASTPIKKTSKSTASKVEKLTHTPATPGITVLQWLTYAFWGWTLISLSVLVFMVVYNLIRQTDVSDTVPYAIAATVILLPISVICDLLYRRHETPKKQGATMLVMVIHAVIFALFAIGSLIGALFALVQMMLSASSDTSSSIATAISLTIVAFLYGLTFIRTLNPWQSRHKIALGYVVVMATVTTLFIILAVAGPVVQSVQTKTDRLIANNLSQLHYTIDDYARENGKLPAELRDLSVDADVQQLIDDGHVRYQIDKPDTKAKELRYQLCTTYTAKDNQYNRYEARNQPGGGYQSGLSTYGHPAGDVCYKQFVNAAGDTDVLYKNFQ